MVRYGRQTVSVDIDAGVLLFDKKSPSFGVETVKHDRSETATLNWIQMIFLNELTYKLIHFNKG